MKATIRLSRVVRQPPPNITTHFITPIRATTSEDWWSARIFWGPYDSKTVGDLIDLEIIFPTDQIRVGDEIEIFGGSEPLAFAEVTDTRDK